MSLLFLIAVSAVAAPVNSDPNKIFRVAGRTFVGTTLKVCDIEGKWSDGGSFRYRAWDSCKKMSIERVPPQTHARSCRAAPWKGPNLRYSCGQRRVSPEQ